MFVIDKYTKENCKIESLFFKNFQAKMSSFILECPLLKRIKLNPWLLQLNPLAFYMLLIPLWNAPS